MDQALLEINQKLDALTAQMAVLSEQARLSAQTRDAANDLVETAVPIARDAITLASIHLEEVQGYVELDDLLRLVKKLVRRVPQIEMLLDQLDSVTDMLEITRPILKEGMDKATSVANELERKGYVDFVQGGMRLADNVVTSFTREDVDRLGDNVVLILNTVKEMTQPEVMGLVQRTALSVQDAEDTPMEPPSIFALLKSMRDPQTRRGLAKVMAMLHTVGEEHPPTPTEGRK
jgi:uncharacterized protein YjgD (DUF1641 family)